MGLLGAAQRLKDHSSGSGIDPLVVSVPLLAACARTCGHRTAPWLQASHYMVLMQCSWVLQHADCSLGVSNPLLAARVAHLCPAAFSHGMTFYGLLPVGHTSKQSKAEHEP